VSGGNSVDGNVLSRASTSRSSGPDGDAFHGQADQPDGLNLFEGRREDRLLEHSTATTDMDSAVGAEHHDEFLLGSSKIVG
jgi:hypothetical protein